MLVSSFNDVMLETYLCNADSCLIMLAIITRIAVFKWLEPFYVVTFYEFTWKSMSCIRTRKEVNTPLCTCMFLAMTKLARSVETSEMACKLLLLLLIMPIHPHPRFVLKFPRREHPQKKKIKWSEGKSEQNPFGNDITSKYLDKISFCILRRDVWQNSLLLLKSAPRRQIIRLRTFEIEHNRNLVIKVE